MKKTNREDIQLNILTCLLHTKKPLSLWQIRYRITPTNGNGDTIHKHLNSLLESGMIIQLGNKYRITDKGIAFIPMIKQLLDMWL